MCSLISYLRSCDLFVQPLTSQKLIYGGRLLLDQQTLAQSLPSDSQQPIIIHLVAYERSHSSPAVSMETKEASPKASRQPSLSPVQEDTDEPDQPQPVSPTAQEQQPNPAHPWPRFRGQTPPMMMGLPPQYYMSPYGAAYANQMALWYQAYYGR